MGPYGAGAPAGRSAPRRRRWPRACLRIAGLGLAVYAFVLCLGPLAGAYRDMRALRGADCPVSGGQGAGPCVRRIAGTVADKSATQSCTWDSFGRRCSTTYELKVREPGRTRWLGVGHDTYAAAREGDPVEVRTWHGAVIGLTVRGHTERYLAPSEWRLLWLPAGMWLIVSAGLWSAFSGRAVDLGWFFHWRALLAGAAVVIGSYRLLTAGGAAGVALSVAAAGLVAGSVVVLYVRSERAWRGSRGGL